MIRPDATGAAILAALLAVLAAPAAAERPLLLPRQDVTVRYELAVQGRPPAALTVAIGAGGSGLRATLQDWPGALLLDRVRQRAVLVLDALGIFTDLPGGGQALDQALLAPGMRFQRLGAGRAAGLSCTEWRLEGPRGQGTACVTGDGVILRGEATDRKGRGGEISATRVSYGPLPPGLFDPPPSYHRLDLPAPALRGLLPGGAP